MNTSRTYVLVLLRIVSLISQVISYIDCLKHHVPRNTENIKKVNLCEKSQKYNKAKHPWQNRGKPDKEVLQDALTR